MMKFKKVSRIMNYRIQTLDEFLIIGQEIELTNSQRQNIQISTSFWRQFNTNLKTFHLSQSGHWIKYALMERRRGRLYYFCAIPQTSYIPHGFESRSIQSHQYMVVEHIGPMNQIYQTYGKIYEKILPESQYIPIKNDFIHFEKYDYRFHWNRNDSVIEIWIPVQDKNIDNILK